MKWYVPGHGNCLIQFLRCLKQNKYYQFNNLTRVSVWETYPPRPPMSPSSQIPTSFDSTRHFDTTITSSSPLKSQQALIQLATSTLHARRLPPLKSQLGMLKKIIKDQKEINPHFRKIWDCEYQQISSYLRKWMPMMRRNRGPYVTLNSLSVNVDSLSTYYGGHGPIEFKIIYRGFHR